VYELISYCLTEKLKELDEIDIVVGIPSFNNEKTISFVTGQIDKGLKKFFRNKKAVIIDSDGGSSDATKKNFLATKTHAKKLFSLYEGIPGKGSALKQVFEISSFANAEATLCVDSDLKSIRDYWVNEFIKPVFDGTDFVVPSYSRYKYDATITNQICYPIVNGFIGKNLRQPIAGDFAFSTSLARFWLKHGDWSGNTARFGIDIFMTTSALFNKFEVVQINIGAKIHEGKDPSKELKPMFVQVVGTLFDQLIDNKKKWITLKKEEIKTVGQGRKILPKPFDIDRKQMREEFLYALKKRKHALKQILSKKTFNSVEALAEPEIDADLWSDIVIDFIASYSKKKKKEILEELIPLWLGRNYFFVEETRDVSHEEAEEKISECAKIFAEKKNALVKSLK